MEFLVTEKPAAAKEACEGAVLDLAAKITCIKMMGTAHVLLKSGDIAGAAPFSPIQPRWIACASSYAQAVRREGCRADRRAAQNCKGPLHADAEANDHPIL
jgi:hypothetical protein